MALKGFEILCCSRGKTPPTTPPSKNWGLSLYSNLLSTSIFAETPERIDSLFNKLKPKATLNNRMFLLCPFYVLFSSVCVLPLENKMKIVNVQKYWKSRSNTQSISPWDSIKYTDNLSYVHIQHIDWPFHTFKNNIHNILGHSTDVIPAWENWA